MTRVTTCCGLILPVPTAAKKSSFFVWLVSFMTSAEHLGADEPLGGQALLAERLEQSLAAQMLRVLAPLLLEPLPDLVARAGARDELQPVARGSLRRLGGEDLDDVARLQPVGERDDAAVDLGSDAAVADVGVDGVGEIDRSRARGQALDLALGREDVHLVVEQVDAQRLHELAGVLRLRLPVHDLPQPLQLLRLGVGPLAARPPFSLYIQWAAMPNWAVSCMS